MISIQTIEKLKKKDEQAFEAIYQKTKHGVYSIIISIVRDSDAASDLMQDTYIEMVSSIYKYNPKYKFYNWLLTIARNKAIDYYRRNKKEVIMSDEMLDSIESVEEESSSNDELAKQLLDILDSDEREIVLLHVVENMKHKEIALIVDKPLGTVLWIYNKAIKKMKKEAEKHEN